MSILRIPILFVGSKGEKHLNALFDSGADLSFIHPDAIKDLENPVHLGRVRQLATASAGHLIEVKEAVRLDFLIEVKERVGLDFLIDDILLSDEFLIVPGLTEEVIFGFSTLQKWRMKLDFEHDRVIINPRLKRLQFV